jgi:hypothetical protein
VAITKVSIISNAITLLGHKPILTLDVPNVDDLVIAAEQAFDMLLPASIAKNSWRFACDIVQLSLIENFNPPLAYKWASLWLLPSGYLGNIRIYPQNYIYEIYADNKILSNWNGNTGIWMEYIFLPDISRLPAWFVNYFVYEIATYLALSNAQKADYYEALKQERNNQMAIAMGLDAKNRPNYEFNQFPMLNIAHGENFNVAGNGE